MNAPEFLSIEVPLSAGHYEADSLPLSAQSCINLYPNVPQAPALSKDALYLTPGTEQAVDAGNGASMSGNFSTCLGFDVFAGFPLVWIGPEIARLDKSATGVYSATNVGGDGTGDESSIVSAADNGTFYMYVVRTGSAVVGRYLDTSWTNTTITDVDFTTTNGVPQRVVFLDGYFVCTTDTDKIKISSLNDPSTWNALDFGSAEADPDGIVAPFVYNNQLIIFGGETFEVFQNIGGTGFPFQRIPGAVYDVGLKAEEAVVRGKEACYFLGASTKENTAIWATKGSEPVSVSSIGIDVAIQQKTAAEISAAYAVAYSSDGHYFVAFTIGNETFVLNETIGRWHVRQSFYEGDTNAWRVRALVVANGDMLVGDVASGNVGILSDDTYTEFGEIIVREFTTIPIVGNGMKPFAMPRIELTIESGVGNAAVEDPQIEMRLSRDGKTWSTWRQRAMGKIGEYNRRAIWRRNGRFERFALMQFRVSQAVNVRIIRLDCSVY